MYVPGQARKLLTNGKLVATTAYPRFQEELRSRYPFLELAMDREDGFWCIVRRDPYRRRALLGGGLGSINYAADVYTPVLYLEYVKDREDGGHDRKFMHPGNWVFRVLARMHVAHLGFDNCTQAQKEMIARDRAERRRDRERLHARVNDGVASWVRHVDRSDTSRFKPSVLVSKP